MARIDLIVCDPKIRGGIPTIKGTRIGAQEIANFAANDPPENVFEAFPNLTEEMIEAAIEYHRRVVADGAAEGEEGGVSDRGANAKRLVRTAKVRFSDL